MGETRDGREFGTNELPSKDTQIAALVEALERLTRVARVELAASRPDVIEQAEAALALARGEGGK